MPANNKFALYKSSSVTVKCLLIFTPFQQQRNVMRGINHSSVISGNPYNKSEISYAWSQKFLLKNEKFRTLNVKVIYPPIKWRRNYCVCWNSWKVKYSGFRWRLQYLSSRWCPLRFGPPTSLFLFWKCQRQSRNDIMYNYKQRKKHLSGKLWFLFVAIVCVVSRQHFRILDVVISTPPGESSMMVAEKWLVCSKISQIFHFPYENISWATALFKNSLKIFMHCITFV